MDEKPEEDNGYVELVYAKKENGEIKESKERTGHWAWKHYHQADNTTTYVEQQGDVVLDGVDFGYTDEKIVLHDIKLYAKPGEKIRICRFYRCRKNDHYQSFKPLLRYSGR